MQDRLAGVFKKALVDKVRPGPASMDPVLIFAALLLDRSHAAILLDGGGALIAGALGTKSTGQARRQGRTGAREALPD